MTVSLVLLIAMVVMYAVGFTLMLDRGLTRILLGFLLVGNATNLLIFLMSGNFGAAPIYGEADAEDMSDPLPQAFILTAIVITFAVTAFLLALIYRSYRVDSQVSDKVADDEEDLELSQDDSVTTEEVTEDDLEESSDFDDPDEAEEIDRDRIEAEQLTLKRKAEEKRRRRAAAKKRAVHDARRTVEQDLPEEPHDAEPGNSELPTDQMNNVCLIRMNSPRTTTL